MRKKWSERSPEQIAKHREQQKEYDRERGKLREPQIDETMAYELAKLLLSGVPPETACTYLNPGYFEKLKATRTDRQVARVNRLVKKWINSPLTLDAVTKLNGGLWHHLDADRRLQIAVDKHMSELAFLLYTHNYAEADAPKAKMDEARNALVEFMANKNADPDAPWMAAIKEIVEGKLQAVILPDTMPSSPVKDMN